MADLSTTYLGLPLKHPVVASASPLTESVENVKRLEDGGAAAVVLASLFEEQLRHEQQAYDHLTTAGTESFAESLSYFPEVEDYHVGPDRYLELIRACRAATEIPVIASLNGVTDEGWTGYARQMQEAGASAIELNVFYIPAALDVSGREVEDRYVNVLNAVKSAVDIPVAIKLSPFFSAMGAMARRLADAGANGLVLFNRFYQPDFDLEKREVRPNLTLSTPVEIRLPLLWLAVLYGRLDGVSLAATRGVHGAEEVIKYVMAGADAVMTTSALLKNGPDLAGRMVAELEAWMDQRGYESIAQMKGSMSQLKVQDPSAFERANYIKVLESYRLDYPTVV